MQTCKHFQQIAEIIARIENKHERGLMAELNAANLAKQNPRFDPAKFFAACGLPDYKPRWDCTK